MRKLSDKSSRSCGGFRNFGLPKGDSRKVRMRLQPEGHLVISARRFRSVATGVNGYAFWRNAERRNRLCDFRSDPAEEQRIQKEILSPVTIDDIARVQRLEGLLHTGRRAEAKLAANSLGIDLRRSPVGQRLQGRTLSSGQLLPKELVVRRLADHNLIDDPPDIRAIQGSFAGDFRVVPKLVCDPLHVIGN